MVPYGMCLYVPVQQQRTITAKRGLMLTFSTLPRRTLRMSCCGQATRCFEEWVVVGVVGVEEGNASDGVESGWRRWSRW